MDVNVCFSLCRLVQLPQAALLEQAWHPSSLDRCFRDTEGGDRLLLLVDGGLEPVLCHLGLLGVVVLHVPHHRARLHHPPQLRRRDVDVGLVVGPHGVPPGVDGPPRELVGQHLEVHLVVLLAVGSHPLVVQSHVLGDHDGLRRLPLGPRLGGGVGVHVLPEHRGLEHKVDNRGVQLAGSEEGSRVRNCPGLGVGAKPVIEAHPLLCFGVREVQQLHLDHEEDVVLHVAVLGH
mmetsp:Transcript_42978/g.107554  ORF Transcript_42978/g.107554 Transcript_42978/m.107554 type:complete len:233 (+) Transcript_42978:34-732(+)